MPSPSPAVVAAVLLIGAAGCGWVLGDPPDPPPVASPVVERVEAPREMLVVHVGGAGAAPGLVEVPQGSRVADAIRSAGGLLPAAAVDGVNLARPLNDGEHLLIPVEGMVDGGRFEPVRISVNRATEAELQSLPGVGPVLAGRIVAHRETAGPYAEVEDLLAVPGIGERMLASLRDLVEVP